LENAKAQDWTRIQAEQVLAWRRGDRPGPAMLELFPTNRCNIQCKHCWQRGDDYDKTYKSEMSDERLEALVDEAHALGVKSWFIKGGGEPLARGKLFMRMAARIRELGMVGMLYTNGTLFKPQQIEDLVAMEWSDVFFSFDSPDQATNDYIRTGGYAKATAAMEGFRDVRAARNTIFPQTHINMVVTSTNRLQLVDMIRFAHEKGCSSVSFSGLIEFTELCHEFRVRPEQQADMIENAKAAIKLARELGVGNNLEDYITEDALGEAREMVFGEPYDTQRDYIDALCYAPFYAVTIHPDGKVGPCCMSYDERSNNINTASLKEVWEGPYLSSVRDHFLRNVPMSYCAQCPTFLYHCIEETREALKKKVIIADAPPLERVSILAGRAIKSLSENGISTTARKAREWIAINRK